MDFLLWTGDKIPRGGRGIRSQSSAQDTTQGAAATITVIADRPGQKGRPRELTIRKTVVRGRETLIDASFGCFRGNIASSELGWSDFAAKLATAVQSPPEQYLLIQLGWEEER